MKPTLALAALILALPLVARAEGTPVLVGHSGRLVQGDDTAVEGRQTLTFRLYALAAKPQVGDESPLWTASYEVEVHHGLYGLLLGNTSGGRPALTSEHLPPTADRYLSVQVGSEGELTPRLRLGVVPMAARAALADLATKATLADRATLADTATLAERATLADTATLAERATLADAAQKLDTAGLAELDARFAPKNDAYAVLTNGGLTLSGTLSASQLVGAAAGLTGLDASKLASGVVPSDRLEGAYARKLQFENAENTYQGTFLGNVSGSIAGTVAPNALTLPPIESPSAPCSTVGAFGIGRADKVVYVCSGSAWSAVNARAAQLDFREARVALESDGKVVVELRNLGDAPATSLGVTLEGAQAASFAVVHDCGTTLAPRASCKATFSGSPTAVPGASATATGVATSGAQRTEVRVAATFPFLRTCNELKLKLGTSATDGAYTIDPDGAGPRAPLTVYCDMTTDGGGWTLVGYSGSNATNIRGLRCGGGSYNALTRTGAASIPSVDIARASTLMGISLGGANNLTGNMLTYDHAYKIALPDPAAVNLVNHSSFGPYTGTGLTERGPCVAATVNSLKGDAISGNRYMYKHSLGYSWVTDAFPTGYGVTEMSDCSTVSPTKGPFLASSHSGSGRNHPSLLPDYADECDAKQVTTYLWNGWFSGAAISKAGSAAVWFK